MRSIIIATAMAAALSPFAVCAQQTKLLTADKHNEYGIVYSLPKTAVTYEITARHTVRVAGPYWQYAKKYIGTDNVIREDEEIWEIEDVRLSTSGIADPSQQYLMQLKPGATTYVGVADDGTLLSINREPAAVPPVTAYRPAQPVAVPDMQAYLEFVNEDFLSSQSTAKQAQLLSESLMEVRDAKISLTRGTADNMPTDGKQLELMLESLARQEKTFVEAFTGAEVSETVTRKFTVMPQEEGETVLFRMSDFVGFVDADDLSGWPVTLDVRTVSEPSIPVNEKGEEKKLAKDAVIYALPGVAELTLSLGGEQLHTATVSLAQFGVTFGLDPKLFIDKKQPSYAVFDPATGALKEIGEVQPE